MLKNKYDILHEKYRTLIFTITFIGKSLDNLCTKYIKNLRIYQFINNQNVSLYKYSINVSLYLLLILTFSFKTTK